MSSVPTVLTQRLGILPRRKGKSLLVWGKSCEGFARVGPLLEALAARNPRLNLFRLGPPGMASEAPDLDLLAAPAAFAPCAWLALVRTRAQLLLLVDPPDKAARQLMAQAAARSLPIATLPGEEDWAAGLAGVLRLDPEQALQTTLETLQPLIAARRSPRGARVRVAAEDPADSGLLAPIFRRKYRGLPDLAALKAALGDPETILCLGNGPSSEDPRLRALPHDALFRVNHFWRARGFLTEPQVVFTGLRAAIRAVPDPVIFAFQTREEERKLKLKCLAIPRRITFATAERLGVMDFGGTGEFGVYTPTNGAVMLATAVALQPKRLIVAGMDLFQHPDGSYPGDTTTPNAYTVLHDRDTELRVILERFARFTAAGGELVLLSEVLESHWQAAAKSAAEAAASGEPEPPRGP